MKIFRKFVEKIEASSRDFRILQLYKIDFCSFQMSRSVDLYLVTDVSRQPIGPILKGKAISDLSGWGDPTVSNANAGLARRVAGNHVPLPLQCADRPTFGRE